MFDKKSSDFCFEKSREIFNKPLDFSFDYSTATLDKKRYDKKTRDLIGENLMDIEKTLNALNLDFLQAFNELEKTDSAETLFGEHFLLENNLKTMTNFNKKNFTNDIDNISSSINHNPNINSTSNINNNASNNNNMSNTKKSATRDYYSPLEKHSDKSYSPKDSQKTTPNSFSPQESTATSRGFFNYSTNKNRSLFLSPTKRMFSNPMQFANNTATTNPRKFDEHFHTSTLTARPRQRSMSFTENFEMKSPNAHGVITKPSNLTKFNLKSMEVRKTGSLDEEYGNRNSFLFNPSQLMPEKPRSVITCKPRSIRARNLRRLSYNPLNMIDSSSSTSESDDMDKSIAHSECDIRSKIYSSRFQRRRQQYLMRKARKGTRSAYYRSENSQYSNSSNPNMNGRDKIYGSNASIKSAPHYNYMGEQKKFMNEDLMAFGERERIIDDKTTMSSSDLDSDDDFKNNILAKESRALTPTPQLQQQQPPKMSPPQIQASHQPVQQFTSNFNNIYEFVGKCFNRNFGSSNPNNNNSSSNNTNNNNNNNNINNSQQQQQQTVVQQTQQFLQNNYRNYKRDKICNSNLDLLYTDFDVSKLTGKSPTTQSYFDIIDYSNMSGKKIPRPSDLTGQNVKGGSQFQWPEKIHGSTVKQNDLIWQLTKQHEQDIHEKEERRKQQRKLLMDNLKLKKSAYSSSSSSADSLNYRQNYMPPAP
jgi:hypothetical protein